MPDYKDRLGEWGDAARRKARELDEKYKIKERVEEGARAAQDAAKRGASRVASEAERAREEAERVGAEFEASGRAGELRDQARQAAGEAERAARAGVEKLRDAGQAAGKRAGDVLGGAKKHYERASKVVGAGAGVARLTSATNAGARKAYEWARANPKQAVMVTLSVAAGVQAGAVFPGLDGVLLGAHPHWLTHSALPVWAMQRAGAKFDSYLREREELIEQGDLGEAERKRAEFERTMVKYVGAPLLGAFSCAAGLAMWAQIFQPGTIVGAPIGWLIGGNPLLSGIWLFGNGVICMQQGYKFFMIALRDQHEAERIVRELRGLLPAAAATA